MAGMVTGKPDLTNAQTDGVWSPQQKTKPQPRIHFPGKNKKGDPMKKAYSLNYDIYSTYDRIDAIAEILDELPQTPNHTDLE